MKGKVSIVTPCYNGEDYVERFLNSILAQTYNNLELIFINDGSEDDTEKIVKSYEPEFKKNNIEFRYIYQENAGQAAALNKGLKLFTGDYLTWPDSDDILTDNSIEKKVKFLRNNEKYGIVRTDAIKVRENNLNKSVGFLSNKNKNRFKENLFDDFIKEKNVWFPGGCYLVKKSAFLDVIPNRKIYESRGGQNWQILLPITNKYKCGYIDEPLYKYVIRDNSHSHKVNSLKEKLDRANEHKDILVNTIKDLDVNQDKYFKIIDEKYKRKKFYLSVRHKNESKAKKYYNQLKKSYDISYKDRLYMYRVNNHVIDYSCRIMKKIKNIIT